MAQLEDYKKPSFKMAQLKDYKNIHDVKLLYPNTSEPISSIKYLISTHSNYFKKKFREKKSFDEPIKLDFSEDIPVSTFITLHNYIFDGYLKIDILPFKERKNLFRLSKYYEFIDVSEYIIDYFILELSIKNCWEIFSLSVDLDEKILTNECVRFIVNIPDYEKFEGYNKLDDKTFNVLKELSPYFKNMLINYEETHYFSKKLNEYFGNDLKWLISDFKITIITKENIVYEFDRNILANLRMILNYNTYDNIDIDFDDEKSNIDHKVKELIIKELSNVTFVDIKNNISHSLGRSNDGKIYYWGTGEFGLSGNEQIDEYTKLNTIHKAQLNKYFNNKNIIEICLGNHHSVALTENGEVYSWGGNYCGQIGNGETGKDKYQTTPFLITTFNNEEIKSISCGSDHSLSLSKNGHVYSWGSNRYGQLGRSTSNEIYSSSPLLIEMNKDVFINKISCGHSHSMLLSKDGDIYVFGSNRSGELGVIDENGMQIKPIKLDHSRKFVDVAAHFSKHFSCALSSNDNYYIWGNCGKVVLNRPKETEYKTFNNIFLYYFGITITLNKGKIEEFNDKLIRNSYYLKSFKEIKVLGKGSFGQVKEVLINISPAEEKRFAIKKSNLRYNYTNRDIKSRLILEGTETSSFISNSSHKNIIKYFDIWFENNINTEWVKKILEMSVYFQMELCDISLQALIEVYQNDNLIVKNSHLTLLGYYISSKIFIQVLEGVNYLHKQTPQIIHRNLNPYNILLKINEPNDNIVKIAGLSLACFHKYKDQSHSKDVGHIEFAAPEVLDSIIYDTKADIYSLGVVLERLFQIDININKNYDEIKEKMLLKKKYKELTNIYFKMANTNHENRPNCQQILEEKDLWPSNESEFNAKLLFKDFKIKCYEETSFISKLIDKFFILPIEEQDEAIVFEKYSETLHEIKNETQEKIRLILDVIDKDYNMFLSILLLTGQDNAALILDPRTIDLTDLTRCDPKNGHVSHFSFGDENPDENFLILSDRILDSKSNAYAMNRNPRGFVYLLNNNFTIGTFKEMQRFRNIFHKLKFDVIMRKNMNANDIYEELKELSQKDELKEHNAFVFMTISHGNAEGEIYGFDGNTLKIQDLMNLFNNDNCPYMRRKPKVFYFNCCRGSQPDDFELIRTIKMNLPDVSDFYLIYSTLYGYVAHVDWNTGTIFGKVLADSFLERVNYRDINGIITLANQKIEDYHPSFRQTFQITQQGTRDLYFT